MIFIWSPGVKAAHTVGLSPTWNLGSKGGHVLASQNRKKSSRVWWRNVRAKVWCQGTWLQNTRDNWVLYLCIYCSNTLVDFSNFNDRLKYFEKAATHLAMGWNHLQTLIGFSGVQTNKKGFLTLTGSNNRWQRIIPEPGSLNAHSLVDLALWC